MSDQSPDQDDILPEYDFSEAVRGKHAGRFSVSREESAPVWLRDAIRYDRQAWISEALRRSQELERLLVVYLSLAFNREPADAGRDVSHLLEDPQSEALRHLIADLEARDLLPSLDRLFNERNWLVHRSFYQQMDEADPKTAGRFTARLQRLSSETAEITELLWQLILARFMRAGMTQAEVEQRAEAVTQQWLAA
jgi:hypothetical protein